MINKTSCFLFLFLLLLSVAGFSQNVSQYKIDVETLCSEQLAGRGYVNNGDSLAANYIKLRLKSANLTPFRGKYLHPFEMSPNTFPRPIRFAVSETDSSWVIQRDYFVHPESGVATGEYTVCDLRDSLIAVPDSVVQPAFLITKDQKNDFLHRFNNRVDSSIILLASSTGFIQSVSIKQESYATVTIPEAVSDSLSGKTIQVDIRPRHKTNYTSYNVIAEKEGKKDLPYIIVTAHYDHLGQMGQVYFPGANDNASGTAMMMALADQFSTVKTKHPMLFIGFSGEEAGLLGSIDFVRQRMLQPKAIHFVLNLDIMGSGSDGIQIVNSNELPKYLAAMRAVNAQEGLLPQIKSRDNAPNSDHFPFTIMKVPAFFCYTLGTVKEYHTTTDTPEKLEYDSFEGLLKLFSGFLEYLDSE
jgi:hypothetical protein